MSKESGFTLVELMVVTAIVAILASVAAPAYINYQNRAKQSQAVEALLRAKMDQETWWAENGQYANTIGCLASFGNSCSRTTYLTAASATNGYTLSVVNVSANTKRMNAVRFISNGNTNDSLYITTNDTCQTPVQVTPNAVKFSVFRYIFK